MEIEADKYSLDALVSDADWRGCLSRFSITPETVKIDADNLGISPSIIAGRIRKERNNYKLLTGLVGQGLVRKNFNINNG